MTRVSADGTRKWLLAMNTREGVKQGIEMVFIPEPGRGTLCISSQVGCAMDCTFCSTAQQGFNRNLNAAEIVGQVWLANKELGYQHGGDRVVTNIVFMGMGEPLANYRNVVPATGVLMDDLGFDISRRRVTVSTSGLVPQMLKLAEETNCALAVSLHAPNDALRDELVPINRKHKTKMGQAWSASASTDQPFRRSGVADRRTWQFRRWRRGQAGPAAAAFVRRRSWRGLALAPWLPAPRLPCSLHPPEVHAQRAIVAASATPIARMPISGSQARIPSTAAFSNTTPCCAGPATLSIA